MVATKKIKDYFNKTMRHVKHRKGFGVHSPYAYSIITEVIEEKLPYYEYQTMHRLYSKASPMAEKQARLIFRLANRFKARNIAEICNDGGYTLLPLTLVDSRNRITCIATDLRIDMCTENLKWLKRERFNQATFVKKQDFRNLVNKNGEVSAEAQANLNQKFDMIIVNNHPFKGEAGGDLKLIQWMVDHAAPEAVILVRGIQPSKNLETMWDAICDRDDLTVTMDLFDLGLGVFKNNYFKQHYIVSF